MRRVNLKPSQSTLSVLEKPSTTFTVNTMTYYSQDDSWNTSFHNVGLMCGERTAMPSLRLLWTSAASAGPIIESNVQRLIGEWLSVSERKCLLSAVGVNAMPEVRRRTKHRSARGSSQRKLQQETRSKFQFVHWSPTGPEGAIALKQCSTIQPSSPP